MEPFSNEILTTEQIADIAQRAAQSVGPYLCQAAHSPGDVSTKRDFHDVVTAHDKEAERRIRQILFEHAPESFVLGEEEGGVINAAGEHVRPGPTDVVWLVDPIDGTSNFASGLNKWCVSIGAARGDDVIAGVIFQPATNTVYRADGTGAYKNGTPISVHPTAPTKAVVAAEFPSTKLTDIDGAGRGFMKLVHSVKSTRKQGSTALDLAEVAEGVVQGTFSLGTQPWDIGAGIALVQQAGGSIRAFSDDRTPTTTRPWSRATITACASDELHDLLLSVIDCVAPQKLTTDFFGDVHD